jgi:hypothetical protein
MHLSKFDQFWLQHININRVMLPVNTSIRNVTSGDKAGRVPSSRSRKLTFYSRPENKTVENNLYAFLNRVHKWKYNGMVTSYWFFKPTFLILKQEVLGRTNRLLSLIRHGPHWKRRVQQCFYCCVCIRYIGNVSTEPLPSHDRGIFTEPLPSNDRGHTQTATWSHKPTLFFQNRKIG